MARSPKKRDSHRPALSPLELEVMDVVWDLGECTSAQVTEAFQRKRPLAPTTIRTVLTSLRKKGYVRPVPTIERRFRLRPVVPRETVARRSLRELLASLFGNTPQKAIVCLLDDPNLSEQELDEIHRLIDARKKKGYQP